MDEREAAEHRAADLARWHTEQQADRSLVEADADEQGRDYFGDA
jgi:hypothetical protein